VASELLEGVERADTLERRASRREFVERIIERFAIYPFTIEEARIHAAMKSRLVESGQVIGAHDLLIAATCIRFGYPLATLNHTEFQRIPDLQLIDTTRFTV
jgi:predicted nucleic acid-binding protein